MTRSSETPPGMLRQPDTDAFPPTAPHTVPAYDRTRWTSRLAHWWHATFARNAYARGPDTPRSGRSGHRFFQHLIETDEAGTGAAPTPGDAGKK